MPNKRQSTVQEESEFMIQPGIVYFLRFSSVEMRVVIVFFSNYDWIFVMNTQYNILQNLLIDKQKCLGCRLPGEWGQGMAKGKYVPVEHEVIGLQNAFVLPLTCNFWLVHSDQNFLQADTPNNKKCL